MQKKGGSAKTSILSAGLEVALLRLLYESDIQYRRETLNSF